ncbi:carbohydrate-binding module family 1 protein, partial [Aureobasidium melanogenum]|jgi:cellulase
MKYSVVSALALAASSVNAHAIMQRIMVDGVDQGSLTGIRAPSSNNPVQDVNSSDILCGASSGTSSKLITIPAGASVAGGWAHLLGGPQGSGDSDNPIASSHKGPTQVYLAKVDDAVSASATGLKWFKIASDAVTSSGVWGVDDMIKNTDSNGFGWQKFTMPSCIAPGQYLMRVELLALHSATAEGGAQFYQSCAQIKVTGSGSFAPSTSNEMSLPGGYSATDPGILANIYDSSIYTSYKAPGPAVISCGAGNAAPATSAAAASSKPATSAVSSKVPVSTSAAAAVTSKPATTLSTVVKTSEAAAPATSAASSGSSSGTAAHWGQCGGQGWTGPTTCISGTTCKVQNDWYSQCL